ncbi:hypothetical protein F2Q69_00054667 [Brassica cretica]|uniref:26S proteasome non-ATPase regulatory subunit 3 N-terminal TPR repeats domain-containing protein n=1 Tax=Brassica cretica TaxID=69181 RepID=A0A8S9MXQ2_BRACR|nr:hypothetical protein F2Q69_00054667 [Brassica cretica]
MSYMTICRSALDLENLLFRVIVQVLFCSCTILRHDVLGQETLLNLFLRNYLPYNLYDKAERLRSKAPRFEAHFNQQAYQNTFYLASNTQYPIIKDYSGSHLYC